MNLKKTEYYSDDDSNVVVPLNKNLEKDKYYEKDTELSVVEENVQKALNETGFGIFNYKIIAITGLICANASFSLTSIAFILPSATCDFQMTTIDKGRLGNAPVFGMMIGSFLWGYLSDSIGRKSPLLACLFLQAIAEFFAGLINNYWTIFAAKIFSGLGIGGQIAILYTYMGEFQPSKYRLGALSTMEIFWVIGLSTSPALAWIIIPLDFEFTYYFLFLNSRNLFMIICSLPSWIIGLWLIFFPETPKFLAESGKIEELMGVLCKIHEKNTGKNSKEYMEKLKCSGIESVEELIELIEERNFTVKKLLTKIYEQTKMIMIKPYLCRTIVVCGIMCCIMSALFTFVLWFPELFERFADFAKSHPNETASVCIVSSFKNNTSTGYESCDSLDTSVFSYTLIIGLSCLPIAIFFPFIINKTGFKFSLIFCFVSSSVVTVGLFFVRSSMENLILSCIFQGLISMSCTLTFCIAVEIFPTNLRVAASSLAALVGRAGALTGNTIFSYLIDSYCSILISFVAIELVLGGVLAIFLPSEDKKLNSNKNNDEHSPSTAEKS